MKKYLLIAAVIGMAAMRLMAGEMRSVPSADTKQPAFVDYAGVYVATMAFGGGAAAAGVNYTTACINTPGVFYGVIFSSGNAGAYDSVSVYDSTSTDMKQSPFVILYNVGGSTASGTANISAASGFSGPRVPIRFSNGLIFKPNTNAYNMISVLYYKEREDK